MDLASFVDAPVVRVVNGTPYPFPRVELSELKPIAARLREEWATSDALLADKHRLTAWERFRADQERERVGVGINDLLRYTRTLDGVSQVLELSSKKAGRADAEHGLLMRAFGATGQANLALDVLSAVNPQPPVGGNGGPAAPAAPFPAGPQTPTTTG